MSFQSLSVLRMGLINFVVGACQQLHFDSQVSPNTLSVLLLSSFHDFQYVWISCKRLVDALVDPPLESQPRKLPETRGGDGLLDRKPSGCQRLQRWQRPTTRQGLRRQRWTDRARSPSRLGDAQTHVTGKAHAPSKRRATARQPWRHWWAEQRAMPCSALARCTSKGHEKAGFMVDGIAVNAPV